MISQWQPFPEIDTPEWGMMNQRRAVLIRKHVIGALTPEEEKEYEYLQRESLAAVDRKYPRLPLH